MTVEQKIGRLIEEAEAQRFAGTDEWGISTDDFEGAARRDGYVDGLRAALELLRTTVGQRMRTGEGS